MKQQISTWLLCCSLIALALGCGKEEIGPASADDPTVPESMEGPPGGMDGMMMGGGPGGMMGGGGPGGFGGGGFDPAAIFDRRDENKDGKLTGEELSGRMADRVEQLDTDKNGEISKEEFEAGIQNMFSGGGPGDGGFGGFGGGGGRGDRPDRPKRPEMDGDDAAEAPAESEASEEEAEASAESGEATNETTEATEEKSEASDESS